MKRLFLVLLIPLIIGIYASYYIDIDMTTISIIVVFLVVGLILTFIFNIGYRTSLWALFFCFGVLLTIKSLDSDLLKFVNKDVELEGIIDSRNIIDEEKSTYIINVTRLIYNDNTYVINEEKVFVNYFDKEILDIGDKIRVKAMLLMPRGNTNPRLFNYRLYLQTKNIHTTINIDNNFLETIWKGELNRGDIFKQRFQSRVIDTLDESLNIKNSGIMKSIVLGDKNFLDYETQSRMKDLGLSHILAVSGLHIGIIYLFISNFFNILGFDKRLSIIFSLIIIWLYGFLIDFPTSVLRTSIMFSLLSLSSLVHKRYDPVNTLSFAAIILLIFRPLWIFDVGFQLSFIATASIIIFTPRIKCLVSIYNKTLSKSLAPLIAVQLGVVPIIAYHFNTYALLSLLSNIILIPIFSISLILCFILLFMSIISIKISIILGIVLNIILNMQNFAINLLYKFPFINMTLPSLGIIFILSYYILILICLRIVNIQLFRPKVNKIIFSYLIFVTLISTIFAVFLNETIIEFIDVGQGDSCLVRTKNKVILIDTGGAIFGDFDVGQMVLLPYLNKKGINKLDAVFITHFHDDHSKGLIPLIGNLEIENIFIGYENIENHLFNEIIYLAQLHDIKIYKILEDDEIYLDKNNSIKVLSPSSNMTTSNINNENDLSLVLLFKTYDKKILFTGDIEKDTEYKLSGKYSFDKIHIIKVPHHGSKTSSTIELLDKTRPSFAVIQVGKNNFGHPNDEIIKRYESFGTNIFRNDENGLITFKINKNNIETSTFIKNKLKLSDIIINYRNILFYLFLYTIVSITLCITYRNSSFAKNTLLEE